MTREEQIRKAAIESTGESERIVDYDNNYHCCNCEGYDDYVVAHSFADGARWADEHQDWKDIDHSELYYDSLCEVLTPYDSAVFLNFSRSGSCTVGLLCWTPNHQELYVKSFSNGEYIPITRFTKYLKLNIPNEQ